VEALGYDGLAVEETKVDPYVVMARAAVTDVEFSIPAAIERERGILRELVE